MATLPVMIVQNVTTADHHVSKIFLLNILIKPAVFQVSKLTTWLSTECNFWLPILLTSGSSGSYSIIIVAYK